MVSYTYQMPSGIPGAMTRPEMETTEQGILDQTTPPTAFGVAIKNVSGKYQPISSSADVVIGILLRPYPTSGNGTDGLGVAVPNKAFPADNLKRGYISVLVNNFAAVPPVKQGAVYVRTANASAGKVIGNFEAAPEVTVGATGPVGTGNGTIGTLSAVQTQALQTPAGVYKAVATAATAFNLVDANGTIIGQTATGVTYTADNGLTFRITVGGTAFVAGDTFTITVTQNTLLVPGNTYFTGAVDAFGNGEVAYNI